MVAAALGPVVDYDWTFWAILFISFIAVGLLSYMSVFLGAVSWMYIMRHYLPTSLMRGYLPSLGVSERLIKRFADELLCDGKVNMSES